MDIHEIVNLSKKLSKEQKAKSAAERLVELSKQNKTVILVGHGIINKLIQKELVALKWIESKKLQNKNWCYGVFELQT